MRGRGRPVNSAIRQGITEILFFMGKGYGYEIYKIYLGVFPKVTMRSIYYHLNKGVELGIFEIEKIKREKGEYSWGDSAEKIYYRLTSNAKATGSLKVKDYLDARKPK